MMTVAVHEAYPPHLVSISSKMRQERLTAKPVWRKVDAIQVIVECVRNKLPYIPRAQTIGDSPHAFWGKIRIAPLHPLVFAYYPPPFEVGDRGHLFQPDGLMAPFVQ